MLGNSSLGPQRVSSCQDIYPALEWEGKGHIVCVLQDQLPPLKKVKRSEGGGRMRQRKKKRLMERDLNGYLEDIYEDIYQYLAEQISTYLPNIIQLVLADMLSFLLQYL